VRTAAEVHRRILAHDPDHAGLWHNQGNTLKKLGRIGQALSAYRQAITLKPYLPLTTAWPTLQINHSKVREFP
jgi:Flp pilus assembly protein TadD